MGVSDMTSNQREYHRYLDPKVLSKISGLELRARLVVEGYFSGIHHSPNHGLSVEFADHRAYTQGDDLRHIDWKLFGKTDKYYIKEYEQETNLDVMLVVDASESMSYSSDSEGLSKYEYATTIAAAIAYLTLQQQDSVGLAVFDDRIRQYYKPSNNSRLWQTIIRTLTQEPGKGKTSTESIFAEVAERLNHRTLIIFISDLFDDPMTLLRGFKRLRYRHHELIVWNIWDHAELTFPLRGPTLFDGLEDSGRLLLDPRAIRARYLEEVESFQERLRTGCGHMRVDFTLFDTSASLDAALSGYLATRSARLRQRTSHSSGAG